MTEIFSFLVIPTVPPQLRTLAIHQRLNDLEYAGDKNDEGEIRADLLKNFAVVHRSLRLMAGEIVEQEVFEDLQTLKQEIVRQRARHPNLAGKPMTKLFSELYHLMKKENERIEREERSEMRMETEKAIFGEDPITLLAEMMDDVSIEKKDKSYIDSITDQLTSLSITPENVHEKPKEEVEDAVLKGLEEMKITPVERVEFFTEARRRLHEERNRRLEARGLPKSHLSTFDFLFPSFSKTFFIFLFTLKGSCPRNRK